MRVSTTTGLCGTVLWKHKMYFSCEDSIRAVKEAGFDAIDMSFETYERDGLPMTKPDWKDWVKRQKELCDSLGLPITQGHAHYYTSKQNREFTPQERERQEQKMLRDIEAAGICEIPWLVFHPATSYDGASYSRRLTLKNEIERFKRFGEVADRHGVGIAIENVGCTKNRDKLFGTIPEDLLELLDCLGDDKVFGICWDTGHGNLNRVNQPEAIRQMGQHLKALHIHDNFGEKDEHQLPYLGNIEWEPLLQALKEVKYAGDFTYECFRFTPGFEPEFHPQAMKFACELARRMVSIIDEEN